MSNLKIKMDVKEVTEEQPVDTSTVDEMEEVELEDLFDDGLESMKE